MFYRHLFQLSRNIPKCFKHLLQLSRNIAKCFIDIYYNYQGVFRNVLQTFVTTIKEYS